MKVAFYKGKCIAVNVKESGERITMGVRQSSFFGRRPAHRIFTFFTASFIVLLVAGCSDSGDPASAGVIDDSPNPSEQANTSLPVDTLPEASDSLPFSGTLTLNDYDWFLDATYLGVTEITISPLTKKRIFNGSMPRRHASGNTVFRQACGSRVFRIVSAAPGTLPVQLTPCSSVIDNPGYSPTNFQFSALSPDGSKVAVEAGYYLNSDYEYWTIIYDTVTQAELARFDGLTEPMWFPDGRLLMVAGIEGLQIVDSDFLSTTVFSPGLSSSAVRNPTLSPDGSRIAFELDQQIWLMNADGTEHEVVAVGGKILRYPTWSPDGSVIAYLATPEQDRYERSIYFVDLNSGQNYSLDLHSVQSGNTNTVIGPMTWW